MSVKGHVWIVKRSWVIREIKQKVHDRSQARDVTFQGPRPSESVFVIKLIFFLCLSAPRINGWQPRHRIDWKMIAPTITSAPGKVSEFLIVKSWTELMTDINHIFHHSIMQQATNGFHVLKSGANKCNGLWSRFQLWLACLFTRCNCFSRSDCATHDVGRRWRGLLCSFGDTVVDPKEIIYRNVKSHKIFRRFFFCSWSLTTRHACFSAIFKTWWQTLSYKHFSGRETFLKYSWTFFSFPVAEDDLGITSLTPSHIQTSSPQPAYATNQQTTNFVTSHMLGQAYGAENSSFGPIHHHHHNTYHAGLPYSYDKYKMPASPSTNVYQHYQGFYGHQMVRQVEYIPR